MQQLLEPNKQYTELHEYFFDGLCHILYFFPQPVKGALYEAVLRYATDDGFYPDTLGDDPDLAKYLDDCSILGVWFFLKNYMDLIIEAAEGNIQLPKHSINFLNNELNQH